MKNQKKLVFNPEKSPKTMCYVLEHDTLNVYCNKCGCPVLTSDTKGYVYQCMNCDEDLYYIETHKGENHTAEQFNQLCLDTEIILELDNEIEKSANVKELLKLQKKQNEYAIRIGGVLNIQEADEIWNGYNRQIIEAYAKLHPKCQIGSFAYPQQTSYTGQKIYNFGCDYIIPEPDDELKQIMSSHQVEPIFDRIEELKGIIFIWR